MNGFGKMRKAAGYTQKDVARISEIPLSTLRRWEQGVNEPDVESMLQLAELYGCTTDDLLETSFAGESVVRDNSADPRLAEIIDIYNSMNNTGRESLLAVAQGLGEKYQKSKAEARIERSA